MFPLPQGLWIPSMAVDKALLIKPNDHLPFKF